MNKSEDVVMKVTENQFNDELSLIDIVALVKRNFYTLLAGILFGGIVGLVIAFAIPAQWQATALLRVGQLGSTGSTGSAVEPSLQVVDRIKNRSFQNDVLKSLGLSSSEDDRAANNIRDTIKVKLEKSDLINLAVRGPSPELAKQYMNAIVNEVITIHTKISEPTINRWQQELSSIQQELNQAKLETERLVKSLNGRTDSLSEKNFSQAALLSNILIAREVELKNSHDRKRVLEEQLSPARTFPTKEIGRIEVLDKPIYPKKSLFGLSGSFFGFILGVLWCMLKSRRSNESI